MGSRHFPSVSLTGQFSARPSAYETIFALSAKENVGIALAPPSDYAIDAEEQLDEYEAPGPSFDVAIRHAELAAGMDDIQTNAPNQ